MARWLEFPHFRAGAFSDFARRGFTASARTGSRLRDSRHSVLGSSVVTEPDSNWLMSIVFNYHTGDILSDTIFSNRCRVAGVHMPLWGLDNFGLILAGMAADRMRSSHPVYR